MAAQQNVALLGLDRNVRARGGPDPNRPRRRDGLRGLAGGDDDDADPVLPVRTYISGYNGYRS